MKVLGKVFITLTSFVEALNNRTNATFKTKIFTIHDEFKQSVGQIRVSISLGLAKLHSISLDHLPSPITTQNLEKVKASAPRLSQEKNSVSRFASGLNKPGSKPYVKGKSSFEDNFDGNKTVLLKHYTNLGQIERVPKTELTVKNEDAQNNNIIPDENHNNHPHQGMPLEDLFVPSIKTIAEGNYCPPLLFFQKVSKCDMLIYQNLK